jgi:hypothetical protein
LKYYVTSRLSENISETPEGFLLCLNVPIARTGEMVYGHGESPIKPGADGRAIVTRESKEVFRPETIASFEGKPFTVQHPEDFVNPTNWKVLAKGIMQNVRRGTGENENDLMADILVTDADAIALVKSGVREVSCGYECEYIEMGVGRGMQTNIIGNHLALVDAGRAGTAYAINDQKGAKMKTIGDKIKGIFARAGDEAAKVVDETSEAPAAAAEEKAPAWAEKLTKTLEKVADSLSVSSPSGGSPSSYDEKKEGEEEKESKDDKADGDKGEEKEESKDAALESRLAKLEDTMNKICDALEMNMEEGASDEGEEEEEAGDDDFEESPAASSMDEKSRIEILAPGLKASGKDAKRLALVEAYKSQDTKAIIDRLNGGKAVDLKKAPQKTIDHLFIGASEVVTVFRTKSFSKMKQARDSQETAAPGPMTAEQINEINAKHYASEKGVH